MRIVAPIFFDILGFTIALSELYRSLVGWVPPPKIEKYFGGELNVGYYPGDIGFDPLGLKPTEPTEVNEDCGVRISRVACLGLDHDMFLFPFARLVYLRLTISIRPNPRLPAHSSLRCRQRSCRTAVWPCLLSWASLHRSSSTRRPSSTTFWVKQNRGG